MICFEVGSTPDKKLKIKTKTDNQWGHSSCNLPTAILCTICFLILTFSWKRLVPIKERQRTFG